MQLRTCAGLGSASFDSFPVKELWADCVSLISSLLQVTYVTYLYLEGRESTSRLHPIILLTAQFLFI